MLRPCRAALPTRGWMLRLAAPHGGTSVARGSTIVGCPQPPGASDGGDVQQHRPVDVASRPLGCATRLPCAGRRLATCRTPRPRRGHGQDRLSGPKSVSGGGSLGRGLGWHPRRQELALRPGLGHEQGRRGTACVGTSHEAKGWVEGLSGWPGCTRWSGGGVECHGCVFVAVVRRSLCFCRSHRPPGLEMEGGFIGTAPQQTPFGSYKS